MTVSISGQVPAEAQNGFYAIEEDWTGDRTPDPIVAVVIIERDNVKLKDASQERQATMKFKHIEPLISAVDVEAARDLLERACGARGGTVFAPAEPDTELDIPVDEPELDLDTPLEGQAVDNVTEGPWEPEVDEGPVPA